MDNKWENKIKDALEDFSIEEPVGLWTSVERGLKPTTRAFSPALVAGVSLAIAASFAIVGVFLFNLPEKSNETAAALALVDESAPAVPALPALDEAPLPAPAAVARYAKAEIPALEIPAPGISTPEIEDSRSAFPAPVSEIALPQEPGSASSDGASVPESELRAGDEGKITLEEFLARENAGKAERRSRLSVALAISGGGGKTDEMAGYGGFNCSSLVSAVSMRGEGTATSKSYSAVLYDNIDKKVATEVRHRIPLQFALTAEYKLSRRLGIESGLVYSRLVSELTSGTEETNYKTTQALNYLGVPLSLNFAFADTKFYGFYVSAGAMLEKCISGKSVTDYYYGGASHSGAYESIRVEPLQWSAKASLGFELALFEPAKLYFEPGLRYNFPADTPVQTIYSERALNFNLRAGLRFSF